MDSINGQYVSNGHGGQLLFVQRPPQAVLADVRDAVQEDAFFSQIAKGHPYARQVKDLLQQWSQLVSKSRDVIENYEDGHANVLTRFVIEQLATLFGRVETNRNAFYEEKRHTRERFDTVDFGHRALKTVLEQQSALLLSIAKDVAPADTAEQPGEVVHVDEQPAHKPGKRIDAAPLSKTRRSAAAKKAWKARKAKAAAVKKIKARKPAAKKGARK